MKISNSISDFLRLSLVLIFSAQGILIAQNQSGAISISDEGMAEPKDYTILDLNSESRGILLPRMSYANMLSIKAPEDGLLVYVVESNLQEDKNGFWYFDGLKGVWKRLEKEGKDPATVEPLGAIIAYTGDFQTNTYNTDNQFYEEGLGRLGSDLEGWAICNGKNGTPDLSARFIVGAAPDANINPATPLSENELTNIPDYKGSDDYEYVGNYSQTNQSLHHIDADQIALHRHEIKETNILDVSHTHSLHDSEHGHNFYRASGSKYAEKYPKEVKNTSHPRVHSTKDQTRTDMVVNLDPYQGNIIIDFPEDPFAEFGTNNSEIEDLDNRPNFYVVIFIIKVGCIPYTDAFLRNEGFDPLTFNCSDTEVNTILENDQSNSEEYKYQNFGN